MRRMRVIVHSLAGIVGVLLAWGAEENGNITQSIFGLTLVVVSQLTLLRIDREDK